MKYLLSTFFILYMASLNAQNTSENSSQNFTYDEFIWSVLKYHPLAKSADLKIKAAEGELLSARGLFDPKLKSSYSNKEFDNKEYYTLFSSKLVIPTPIGIDVTGGYELNDGVFLNPENNITNRGLWSVGLEVDVLQGLFTNTRRTTLKQAKIYQDIAKNQQQQMINELLYDATTAYNDWQQYYRTLKVIKNNIALGEKYKTNTYKSFKAGEKNAIDTLEASINLESLKVKLFDYQQLLNEKKQKLENHLWFENKPVLIQSQITPQNPLLELNVNTDSVNINPEIAEKLAKKQQIILKQKLARENIKPKLKLKYNQLLATDKESLDPIYNVDNYKWGASFSFPILARKARGKLIKAKSELAAIDNEIAFKQQTISNKININQQQQNTLKSQLSILRQNLVGYQKLLKAENTKLAYGESSIFLINKRQEKAIEAELKVIKTEHELIKTELDFLILSNQFDIKPYTE